MSTVEWMDGSEVSARLKSNLAWNSGYRYITSRMDEWEVYSYAFAKTKAEALGLFVAETFKGNCQLFHLDSIVFYVLKEPPYLPARFVDHFKYYTVEQFQALDVE